jgi:uroporphyrinogen-III synthase
VISPLGRVVRVAATRPEGRNQPIRERLEAAGVEVVEVPLIAIAPPPDGGAALRGALSRLEDFGIAIATSPGGADAVARLAGRLPAAPPWAAVGEGTAEILRVAGADVRLVPATASAGGLAAELPPPRGSGRALLVQPEHPSPGVVEALTDQEWHVTSVVAYRTVPAHPSAADVRCLAACDLVMLASPSAARRLAALSVMAVPVVCIGSVTAAAARSAGLTVAGVADNPDPDAFTAAAMRAVGLSR